MADFYTLCRVLFLSCSLFIFNVLAAQPVADFSAKVTSGCSPLKVDFVNKSVGATSYTWFFGNGNSSNLTSPSAIYNNPGKYTVTLVAKSSSGATDTFVIKDYITVFKSPQAGVKVSSKSLCMGDTAVFSDNSIAGDGPITSYKWDLGNGGTSSQKNFSYTYKLAGQYDITLAVQDTNGCSSSVKLKKYIFVFSPPTVSFTADTINKCKAPATVHFKSLPSGSGPYKYSWNFGDNGTATDSTPTYVYNNTGQFGVSLKVWDKNGCTVRDSIANYINITPPTADFGVNLTHICAGDAIQLFPLCKPNDGTGSYLWDNGNGSTSTVSNPQFTYNTPGKYTITLKYTWDGCDATAVKSGMITVDSLPNGKITPGDTTVCRKPGTTLSYQAIGNNFTSVQWLVNGNVQNTLPKGTPYQIPIGTIGRYKIQAQLISSNGCKFLTDSVIVNVRGPQAAIVADSTKGCAPYPVNAKWTGTSQSPIANYSWQVDGNSTGGNNSSISFSNTKFGSTRIFLRVTDANGCEDTISIVVKAGMQVNPVFTLSKRQICNNEPLTIRNFSSPKSLDSVQFYYTFNGTDSLPFLPVDSLVKKFHAKPKKDYHFSFTSNSFGCITRMPYNQEPLLDILGPLLQANVNPNCDSNLITGSNTSIDFNRGYWRYKDASNTVQMNNALNFKNALNQTNDLWLFVFNDTNNCKDSMPFPITVDTQKVFFTYTLSCSNGHLQTQNAYKGNASTKFTWTLTNTDKNTITTHSGKDLDTMIGTAGNYKLNLAVGNSSYSCSKPYEVKFSVRIIKPAKSIVTLDRTSCYPVKITMTDSGYSNWASAAWNIDGKMNINDSVLTVTTSYTGLSGNLKVYLNKNDTSGCTLNDTFNFTVKVNNAAITFNQKLDCNKPWATFSAQVPNARPEDKFTYLWDFGSKTSTQRNDTVYYNGATKQFAKLTATDQNGCASTDTGTFVIQDPRPKAAFSASDTLRACPPLNVNFKDSSQAGNGNIISWFWDFGDSSYSEKNNPGKLYIVPGKYSVSLVVENSLHCKDTATIPDLVVVEGTVSTISIDNNRGCAPVTINFKNKINGSVAHMDFDMGDGNVLQHDTSKHEFVFPGVFIPRIIVIDSNGCKYSPEPKDTIRVYPKPQANFSGGPVCNGKTDTIISTTISQDKITSIAWYEMSKQKGTTDTLITQFTTRGLHTITLKVVTENQCTDSISKPFVSYALHANLIAKPDERCLGSIVQLQENTWSDTTLAKHELTIGSNNVPYNSPLTYTASEKGKLAARYIITDILGCTDTFYNPTFLKVGDTVAPTPLHIFRSTVLDNFSTGTKFASSKQNDFKDYHLYVWLNNQWTETASSNNIADTNLISNGLNTLAKSYCHMVRERNYCGVFTDSLKVIPHCTVETKAFGDTNAALVQWTAYSGWNAVDKYRIWRKKKTDVNFVLLDSVAGNQLSYIDSAVYCHVEYDFHIEAIEKGGDLQNSFSDTANCKPIHSVPVPTPQVWITTVDTNAYVRTDWIMPVTPKFPISSFTIMRQEPTGWQTLASGLDSSKFTYNDHLTDVQSKNYTYKIVATDVCNTVSAASNVGRSILLNIINTGVHSTPELNWTPYIYWNEGVEKYRIERSIMGSPFINIGQVDAQTFVFQDPSLPTTCARDFVYRVVAVRNQPANPDSTIVAESVSNYSNFVPEIKFFIPNAFTPDRNNLNEGFKPEGVNYYKYDMKIYNRYGQKIYDNDACQNAWDGNFEGQMAPEGVYAYYIQVWDLGGKKYDFRATFNLLR